MKTLSDLFALIALTIGNQKERKSFFCDYSGHVNQLSFRYYFAGWQPSDSENHYDPQKFECYLNDNDSIQAAYYWLLVITK